jgi:hypothetical protein
LAATLDDARCHFHALLEFSLFRNVSRGYSGARSVASKILESFLLGCF